MRIIIKIGEKNNKTFFFISVTLTRVFVCIEPPHNIAGGNLQNNFGNCLATTKPRIAPYSPEHLEFIVLHLIFDKDNLQ